VSRSAKPHYRNRVDASVSGGERETPAADEQQARERGLDALLLARSNQEPRVSGANRV
jgi:hypothetical protein